VIGESAGWVAKAADARLGAGDAGGPGPERVLIDSREAGEGDLFVALPGERVDGGAFAPAALEAGAWGAIVGPAHEAGAVAAAGDAVVLVAEDPLAALQDLARAWRRELGCRVVGVTGSTGKTSTKDILAALLRPALTTHANRENLNTEIGLPLSMLEAPPGTEAMVLEMAMRGEGQIAELVAVAEPDVGLIVNIGPVHLELLGTVERVAAAKAELIRDLRPGATCVVPAGERLLDRHLRDDLETVTFGEGGEVQLVSFEHGHATIQSRARRVELDLPYSEAHNLTNTLAAVGAAGALGVHPSGPVEVAFSSLRGHIVDLPGGVTVVNDCYNANPMSMRAALEHLAASPAERRLAVLGTMAELGEGSERYHRAIGEQMARLGIDVLITVGDGALSYADGFGGEIHSVATPEEAADVLEEAAAPGDRVLIKGSRSVGLERVLA
jgi:UDP-N-acetylmuramoyl-tripeptide--D-alanyl-D-alanine ligase